MYTKHSCSKVNAITHYFIIQNVTYYVANIFSSTMCLHLVKRLAYNLPHLKMHWTIGLNSVRAPSHMGSLASGGIDKVQVPEGDHAPIFGIPEKF